MAMGDLEEAVAALEGTPYHDAVAEIGSKPLHLIEDKLDRNYYAALIKAAQGRTCPARSSTGLMRWKWTSKNLDSAPAPQARRRRPAAILEHMIPRIRDHEGELSRLAPLTWAKLVAALEKFSYYAAISERLAQVKGTRHAARCGDRALQALAEKAFEFSGATRSPCCRSMGYILLEADRGGQHPHDRPGQDRGALGGRIQRRWCSRGKSDGEMTAPRARWSLASRQPGFTLGFAWPGRQADLRSREPKQNGEAAVREVVGMGEVASRPPRDDFASFSEARAKRTFGHGAARCNPVGRAKTPTCVRKIKQAVGVDLWK